MKTHVVCPEPRIALSDEEIVGRVRAGELDLFELLMRRYNQRVYRIARAVLRSDSEAEDVVQEAWVRAYAHLDQFEGRALFSTWVGRIALHEAWARSRRGRRFETMDGDSGSPMTAHTGSPAMTHASADPNPEGAALARELQALVEAAVESLPEGYRTVFVLRQIEDLSTAETAECLELSEEAVKTRLHRARTALRRQLLERAGDGIRHAYPFLATRCDRMVAAVLGRIRSAEPPLLPAAPR